MRPLKRGIGHVRFQYIVFLLRAKCEERPSTVEVLDMLCS